VKVKVRLFAALHELLGQREVTLDLSEGATIDDLRDRLVEEHPIVRTLLPTLVWAVNEEYVPSEHRLRDGDEVALIPPISGG
jgi:molybdopterin converting factor subunit 1